MPGPAKRWDEEEEETSSGSESGSDAPAVAPVHIRRKFDDEEAEDDVLDSWDAAEDSDVEREKAKKAEEAKAKAAAEAAANKKSKSQRIAEKLAEKARRLEQGDESSDDDETEADKRERLRRTEQEADLKHAEDLFAGVGISSARKGTTAGTAVVVDPADPNNTVNLAAMPLFNPNTKTQFENLRNTMIPIIGANNKKAHYALFLQEFCKQLAKDLPSDQIKKIASTLTALSNEKLKEEKAAEKGGKKSKAAKSKTTLAGVSRGVVADTNTYDDDFGDDDFM
ncbi:translation initiation factor eIF3 subunit [Coniochaeta sp. 2T2.1]|nr:translation initiation factor eIF3 subunit [Coniochaeta sp. 2T2.1]